MQALGEGARQSRRMDAAQPLGLNSFHSILNSAFVPSASQILPLRGRSIPCPSGCPLLQGGTCLLLFSICKIIPKHAGPWRRAAAKPQDGCGTAAGPQFFPLNSQFCFCFLCSADSASLRQIHPLPFGLPPFSKEITEKVLYSRITIQIHAFGNAPPLSASLTSPPMGETRNLLPPPGEVPRSGQGGALGGGAT